MGWFIDNYIENLYNQNKPEFEFRAETLDEWRQWNNDFRKAFINVLGGFPAVKTDLNPVIIEKREYDSYSLQRVVFTSDLLLEVPAYVLIPKSGATRKPAVIACHGHGYGSRDIVGLNPDGTDKSGSVEEAGYQKNFAIELVKRGFLVIAPEIFGFGDRRLMEDADKPLGNSSCNRATAYLMMMGRTIAGVRVWDTIRTIDYLCTREDVDSGRIGCMGISGGGLVCGFSAAVDERIKVSVISGYTNTFKDSVMAVYHCVDNFVHGLVKYGEMYDILGLIAPRYLLIESGTEDPIFPVEATRKAYSRLEVIYGLLNAKSRLDKEIFQGEHRIWGIKAYKWFESWL